MEFGYFVRVLFTVWKFLMFSQIDRTEEMAKGTLLEYLKITHSCIKRANGKFSFVILTTAMKSDGSVDYAYFTKEYDSVEEMREKAVNFDTLLDEYKSEKISVSMKTMKGAVEGVYIFDL